MTRPHITDVVVTLASDHVAATGLEAWCSLTVNGLALDGYAIRTTAGGELWISAPARKSGNGALHPIVRAVDPVVDEAMKSAILAQYVRACARRISS